MTNSSLLKDLLALFPAADYLRSHAFIPAAQVPPPYHGLLCHEHHMTVTVEAHHGDLVNVRVLDRRRDGQSYARKILLALRGSGKIVLFGLVRIHLDYCSPEVQREIVSEKTPLGRILINHNVLRRIEPTGFLKITPGPAMMDWFKLTEPKTVYGRTAIIHCDGKPAVELLEIVTP